ncbi:MAG: glycoside hydrolase N-terminal domain-containing protein [Verrucomicrobiia bacterium]
MRRRAFSLCFCACAWLLCFAEANAAGSPDRFPAPEVNPVLAAPITTWDEAIPLGNGLLGGLLWGENDVLRLSLDRGDLWDERPAAEKEWWKKSTYALMQQLVREGRHDEVNRLYDAPYNGVSPTKLPAGRLEITLAAGQKLEQFELNLRAAEGLAHLTSGPPVPVFFAAQGPVAMLRIPGAEPRAIRLFSPLDVHRRTKNGNAGPSSGGSVDRLGYPEAHRGQDGRTQWYIQEAAEGLRYCVCVDSIRNNDATVLAVTVTSTRDSADPLQLARQRCAAALRTGFEAMRQPHLAWWDDFWAQSAVRVPELEIQRQYCLVQYFYGAASRRGAPPMPLQGVWTADSGGLPPWKGDYHNDLNTQMTYIAYQGAGHFDEGASFLDLLWDLLPKFRDFARDFYGTPGAAVPGVMSLAGQPLGGWGQYSLSPTMGAWNAHLFYLHWRYTGDDAFLRSRAYPWCQEVGQSLRALLKPNDRGVLVLPLSTSPEIYDNTGRAWLEPNSNYDLACLKMLFLSLAEMADACGKPADAREWSATAAALGDFHVNADELLLIDARQPLPYSHRHLSNLMGLYPFNLTTPEGGPRDQKRIGASLAQWDQLGPSQWCGYSYSWMSCLRARVGDAELALRHLDIFVKAFVLRNGFHANGDQTKSGFSSMTYRPFTLEGNFLAAQAVQEMLLQSWSPTPGQRDTEILRIFPATPWRWHAVAFDNLRAEGGHRVSASRENNATTWFEVVAGKDGQIRIRDNFGQRTPQWNREDVKKVGERFEVILRQGETLSATFAKPGEIPPPPANLAAPVSIATASGRAVREQ